MKLTGNLASAIRDMSSSKSSCNIYIYYNGLRHKKSKIQELFVECTKIDVNMNSLVMRGKNLDHY